MTLVNDLTNVEEKLLEKMTEGNSKIQLIASDGQKSFVCIGDKRIDPGILLLCHVTSDIKVCNGNIGSKKIALAIKNQSAIPISELRVIIDRRSSEEQRFYGFSQESAFALKKAEVNGDHLLIAYVENQSFGQLTIFNSKLQSPISEIVVRKQSLLNNLRTNAFTLISMLFPNINDFLREEDDME